MTTDLWMLVAAVGLCWAQIMLAATPGLLLDPMRAFGNRDTDQTLPPWGDRAIRASNNMKENLPLFASLILVAHAAGEADRYSALGAQVFVVSRLVYAVLYVFGIRYLRSVMWGISVAAMLGITAALWLK